jgi:hypothetical protein
MVAIAIPSVWGARFTVDAPFGYNVRWDLTRQPSEATSYERKAFMALLSELVKIVAAVEGLDEVSVGIFARAAREAGYIAQGGRGRSAAKMSVRDAANLLIAVNGCALAKEVPTRVEQYRGLVAVERNRTQIEIGHPGHLFGDDLERIIELMAGEVSGIEFSDFPSPVILRFERPHVSVEFSIYTIEGGASVGHYGHYRSVNDERSDMGDRLDLTVISAKTIRAVAKAL